MTEGSVPDKLTHLRACLHCHIIKSESQWTKEGCDNCAHLGIKNDYERMLRCTSNKFEGIIALMSPNSSWVAKWNRLADRIPGCYAVDVAGTLPEDFAGEEDKD